MDGTVSARFAAEYHELESLQRVHHAIAIDVLVGWVSRPVRPHD
jgi:hypothetical protein